MQTMNAFRLSSSISATGRAGRVSVWLVVLLAVFSVGGWWGWNTYTNEAWNQEEEKPITVSVEEKIFVHEVIERGEVESSSNVDIRCEVQSRNSGGTTILEIVPEGAQVKEGEFLVRLDDSALQNELLQQQIVCSNSNAQLIQAKADVENAKLALDEYKSGTYKQEVEQQESAIFVAEEGLRRAEETMRYSERLSKKGYISQIQLEAERFAVSKTRKELEVALTKINVLKTFTKEKMLNQLRAQLETSDAKMQSRQKSHQLDENHLVKIRTQIARCIVTAPSDGQVVYANGNSSRKSSGGGILIEEGRLVRERQTIIRLPDPGKMQVIAKINESRIDLVKSGMKARFTLEAFPEIEIEGVVRNVGEYPIPVNSSWQAHVKDYACRN